VESETNYRGNINVIVEPSSRNVSLFLVYCASKDKGRLIFCRRFFLTRTVK
jgi:hypothetical protein